MTRRSTLRELKYSLIRFNSKQIFFVLEVISGIKRPALMFKECK